MLEMEAVLPGILSLRSYTECLLDIPAEEGLLSVPVITSHGELSGCNKGETEDI